MKKDFIKWHSYCMGLLLMFPTLLQATTPSMAVQIINNTPYDLKAADSRLRGPAVLIEPLANINSNGVGFVTALRYWYLPVGVIKLSIKFYLFHNGIEKTTCIVNVITAGTLLDPLQLWADCSPNDSLFFDIFPETIHFDSTDVGFLGSVTNPLIRLNLLTGPGKSLSQFFEY